MRRAIVRATPLAAAGCSFALINSSKVKWKDRDQNSNTEKSKKIAKPK